MTEFYEKLCRWPRQFIGASKIQNGFVEPRFSRACRFMDIVRHDKDLQLSRSLWRLRRHVGCDHFISLHPSSRLVLESAPAKLRFTFWPCSGTPARSLRSE